MSILALKPYKWYKGGQNVRKIKSKAKGNPSVLVETVSGHIFDEYTASTRRGKRYMNPLVKLNRVGEMYFYEDVARLMLFP